MRKISLLLAVASTFALGAAASAHADDAAKNLINTPNAGAWQVYGNQTHKPVKDAAVQGGGATEVKVLKAGATPYETAAQVDVTGKIAKGDKLQYIVYLKGVTDDASPVKLHLRAQINAAPYSAIGEQDITIDNTWQLYEMDAVADKDYAKGTTVLAIHLAQAKQTIDLGPAFILDMGQ